VILKGLKVSVNECLKKHVEEGEGTETGAQPRAKNVFRILMVLGTHPSLPTSGSDHPSTGNSSMDFC
jgi:hypothetical protein